MGDFLYALAQVLCLLGLAWGAILAISTSETLVALGQARFEHRLRTRRAQRHLAGEGPHLPRLGCGH